MHIHSVCVQVQFVLAGTLDGFEVRISLLMMASPHFFMPLTAVCYHPYAIQ